MATISTPRRIYGPDNICVFCSFSFVQTDITGSGRKVEKKHLKQKLRFTEERVALIKLVINNFTIPENTNNGICQKCYRLFEKIINNENEAKKTEKQSANFL